MDSKLAIHSSKHDYKNAYTLTLCCVTMSAQWLYTNWHSRTFIDLHFIYTCLSRTKTIFKDFPEPKNWREKFRHSRTTFQEEEAWEPSDTQSRLTETQHTYAEASHNNSSHQFMW